MQKWEAAIFILWKSVQDQALLHWYTLLLIYWLTLLVKGSSQVYSSSGSSQIAPWACANPKLGICKGASLFCKPLIWPRLATKKSKSMFQFVLMGSDLSSQNSCFPQEFQFVCSCFPYCMPIFSSQLSSLKQQTFLTLQFLKVKNLEVVYLAPWAHGLSLGCSQGIGHDSSLVWRPNHWRICFQASSCRCWQDSAHHRSWDWGPHFLTGCWPEAPSIICNIGLSTGESHHGSWLPSEQANERAREGEQDRQQSHFAT